MKVSNVVYV